MKKTEITNTFFATSTGYKMPMNKGDLLTRIAYNDKTEDSARADDRMELWSNTDKSDEIYWLYVGQNTPLFDVVKGIKTNTDKGITYSRTVSKGREWLIKGTPERVTALYKALARLEIKKCVDCSVATFKTDKELNKAYSIALQRSTTPKQATEQGATA